MTSRPASPRPDDALPGPAAPGAPSGKTPPTVLVVEDDPSISTLLVSALEVGGFTAHAERAGGAGLFAAGRLRPDLIVLDVMLPDLDGFEVARRLRAEGSYTPVLFLTARTGLSDRIAGLSSGDDYVTKPFHVEEVLLRIRAILRRASLARSEGGAPQEANVLRYADLVLDVDAHEVRRDGELITLSPTEFTLLKCLLERPDRVWAKSEILQRVWRYDFRGDARIVDTYIRYLRRKIDRDGPPLLHTVRGVGYCLRLPKQPAGPTP